MGILVALTLGWETSAAPQDKVILGRDTYFQGGTLEVGRGEHYLYKMRFERVASSIEVPAGMTVTLQEYPERDYQENRSACHRFDGPVRIDDLKRAKPGGRDWNDRISVITVCPSNDHGCIVPILFKDVYFRGPCKQLHKGYEPRTLYWLNDQLSSLIVPQGWTVTLYQHADHQGASAEVKGPARVEDMKNGPREDLRRLHDKVSSIKVKAP